MRSPIPCIPFTSSLVRKPLSSLNTNSHCRTASGGCRYAPLTKRVFPVKLNAPGGNTLCWADVTSAAPYVEINWATGVVAERACAYAHEGVSWGSRRRAHFVRGQPLAACGDACAQCDQCCRRSNNGLRGAPPRVVKSVSCEPSATALWTMPQPAPIMRFHKQDTWEPAITAFAGNSSKWFYSSCL